MGLFDTVTNYFASYTNVSATSNSVAANELENAIKDLSGKYRLGRTTEGEYIKFGVQDDFPVILDKMMRQNHRLRRFLTKKAKMVAGQT